MLFPDMTMAPEIFGPISEKLRKALTLFVFTEVCRGSPLGPLGPLERLGRLGPLGRLRPST